MKVKKENVKAGLKLNTKTKIMTTEEYTISRNGSFVFTKEEEKTWKRLFRFCVHSTSNQLPKQFLNTDDTYYQKKCTKKRFCVFSYFSLLGNFHPITL